MAAFVLSGALVVLLVEVPAEDTIGMERDPLVSGAIVAVADLLLLL